MVICMKRVDNVGGVRKWGWSDTFALVLYVSKERVLNSIIVNINRKWHNGAFYLDFYTCQAIMTLIGIIFVAGAWDITSFLYGEGALKMTWYWSLANQLMFCHCKDSPRAVG